jgi:hypothetical protein
MILNPDGKNVTGEMTKEPPGERDNNLAEAGEASGVTGQCSGEKTGMPFMAPSEQWVYNKIVEKSER